MARKKVLKEFNARLNSRYLRLAYTKRKTVIALQIS
jgi:hypothetical protein